MDNKPMTNELRKKIKKYIKNKIDISELIKGIDIRGEDLSYSIIEDFNRINGNICRTNLDKATIGKIGKVTNLCGLKAIETNFSDVKFLGKIFLRRANCTDSNFQGADLSNVEYQKSNFTGCRFCEALIRLGTNYGQDAIFDDNMFRDLTKGWRLKVEVLKEANNEK